MPKSNSFKILFGGADVKSGFHLGQAPLAHLDSLTSLGNGGHYSSATNVDIISTPNLLTQGFGLATLTNGTEAGAVTELMNFIIDKPVASGITYGVSTTKLHQISATTVTNSGNFPHAITSATAGSSCIYFQGSLYYFFNESSAGECGKFDLSSSFTDNYMSTVPTGAAALQKADHPVATKQDIMLFGNGRYVGTFISSTTVLNDKRLDFGQDALVADVCFHANQWLIAVNVGTNVSTDRQYGSIYYYDPSASTALLTDEVAVGAQKIGFLLPIEGICWVAYQDLTSAGGFCIGYISGRAIKPVRYFTGTLPTFAQKSLYNNTIIFISNGQVMSCGAVTEQLPVQISQLASGGFTTVGALSAPFGTPMVASTQSTSFKLAKFSGYTVTANWQSIVIPTINENLLGFIDKVVVLTNTLGSNASCSLTLKANQTATSGSAQVITTSGKRRHTFNSLGLISIEDFAVYLDWSGGSVTNPVKIREIQVSGHWVEKK